ncbi:MAG: DUF368 domain-containing protein [Myxococcota bacterium]
MTSKESAIAADAGGSDDGPLGLLAMRSAIGGVLMGLANLVPGISGGTMLLASGVYLRFINAISEVTRFRFRKSSMLSLGVIVVAAAGSILLFAGPVKALVVSHRWIMYSLFIGLTLGGVPLVWKLARPATGATWGGFAVGFGVLGALAFTQVSAGANTGFLLMFIAGLAGASAMILPGVSGGYLLVLMGAYVPILSGIDAFKEGLKAGSMDAMMGPLMAVVLPVGLGVLVGVLVVSNGLRIVLERYEKATLGVLLGFLVGSVVGLWPFQQGVEPAVGSLDARGRVVTAELLAELTPEKWPTQYFTPTATQIVSALALVAVGGAATLLVARIGEGKAEVKAAAAES